ncbi:vicilin-like seed storage protein At2g28490 [Macadamia integrifolia]|uniref:vicilin-like seed storage protein At2g28490 n=1 Tax=Macadamia integrifolia TaxID=60698 RepID=UPI001C4F4706|nr:vicilin-like seed storage protein At2g28490 [Macadamia integrifolia]
MGRMKQKAILLLLLLVIFSVHMAMGYNDDEEGGGREGDTERGEGRGGEKGEGEEGREDEFLLRDSKQAVSTEAGEMRVVKGFGGRGIDNPIHIGFINMEPKTLFLPQYTDTNLILFVRRGEVKIGWIDKDRLVERQLRIGDIYRIPAGYAFYLLNTGEGQRLQVICSIDKFEKGQRSYPIESFGQGPFQSFFIGGGTNPTSVLAGFDHKILKTAFNVSSSELEDIMMRQQEGPIVYVPDAHQPGNWESFMKLKQQERIGGLMGVEGDDDDEDEELVQEKEEQQEEAWTWRKLLKSVMGVQENEDEDKKSKVRSPDAYNLYDTKPDFRNRYGWSIAVDKHDFSPLKKSNVGVYLVNLSAGSMMAPHVNPIATEYGIVLSGEGSLQVVYPDGTSAMNAKLKEGDVFVVPRYFPFCQIASRSGAMEFFGFATSARKNRPQFLVGANSILQAVKGPELAMAFDMIEERLGKLIDSQRESIILPTLPALPGKEEEKKRGEGKEQEEEKKKREEKPELPEREKRSDH